jgi:hypothetical protein
MSGGGGADCLTDIKDRLLKAAVNRHPYMLSSIKNQPTKDLVMRMLEGNNNVPANIGAEQLHSLNEWLDDLETGVDESRSPGCLATTTRFNPLLEVPKVRRNRQRCYLIKP